MSDEQTPKDEFTLERRKFLALLSAAGIYVPPAAAALLAGGAEAWAQSVSSSSSSASSTSTSSFSYSSSGLGTGTGSTSGITGSTSGLSSSGSPTPISAGTGEVSGYSGSGSSSGPSQRVLYASGDAFIRRESPNTNEGGNPRVRVGVGPVTRGLVQFDAGQLAAYYYSGARVQLVLRIASNDDNWGQQDNRTVDAIALLGTFVEGNGMQSCLPGSQAVRGTGAGATWFSPDDPNVADNSPRGARSHWKGGDNVAPQTTAGLVHINQQVNVDVAWDVTKDVENGYSGWLIKVTDEGEDGEDPRWNRREHGDDEHRHGRLPVGSDGGHGGTVEYYSKEGASAIGQSGWAPRLVISY